jgi:hypothetical protein
MPGGALYYILQVSIRQIPATCRTGHPTESTTPETPKSQPETLHIGLAWFQLQSGITHPILECPKLDLPYLKIGWFRSLHTFLCSIQAEVHVELTHAARPLRLNDTSIMDALLALQTIAPKRLYCLNLCRLFLQVECVSEICNPLGTEILREVWHGHRPHDPQTALL